MRFVIVGTGRCGTRLLLEMLNRHPQLLVVNESHFLPDFRARYGSRPVQTAELVGNLCRHRHATYQTILQSNLDYFGIPVEEMEHFFGSLIQAEPSLTVTAFYERLGGYWAQRFGRHVWADKTPDYGCFLGELREMWPGIKVIHVTRDGLSVARSMFDHIGYRALVSMNVDWWGQLSPLDINWPAFLSEHQYEPAQMVELWARRYLRICDEVSRLPAGTCMEVAYDDLLKRPASVLEGVARFAGLDPSAVWARDAAGIIEPAKVARPRPTPSEVGLSEQLAEVPTARRLLADAVRRTRDVHTIVGLAMVKNEEGIIEAFVRHNLRFVDTLCVLENGSTDATRDILVALQREGLPIVIFDDPEAAYVQSEKMTKLLKAVMSTMFPGFAIPIDADEFIKCASKEQLLASLQAIPQGGVGVMAWHTYVLRPGDAAHDAEDMPRAMTFRRRQEQPPFYKVIPRLDGQYMPELTFTQGNHAMERTDHVPVKAVMLTDVALGHFPVRTTRQMEAKAIVGWTSYLIRDPNSRYGNLGFQWREAFDQVMADGGFSQDKLAHASMMYAQQRGPIDWETDVVADPMDFRYERRYDGLRARSMLSTIARSIEGMLAAPPPGFADQIARQCREKAEARGGTAAGDRSPSTAFPAAWHFEHLFLDLPPFRHLAEVLRPQSVLDVGCGAGAYLLYFVHKDVTDVLGIDGIPAAASLLPEGRYLQHDLSAPFDLGRRFDMVLCVEVLEHLPAADADRMLGVIAQHASRWIVFSAAEPGQPGVGHINCRPLAEWLEAWRALGWQCDVPASLAFRALSSFHWLRRNAVVLRKSDDGAATCAVLEEIARRPFTWHAQQPAIRSYPLGEDLPSDLYEPGRP